jgi:catechol 2,3-dioxygenase-like lactoylglutathione lyase family enzyme
VSLKENRALCISVSTDFFQQQRDLSSILPFEGTLACSRTGVCYWRSVLENVMKIVPVIKSSDLQRSLHFYIEVLDFERKWPGYEDREMANGIIDLVRDGAELQLSRHSEDGVFGSVNRVFVDDVDERYVTFGTRGLNTTQRPESPIHTSPVDQTWGLREFAVTDPDGNNLCFCMPKR